jgi:hypothetical protein
LKVAWGTWHWTLESNKCNQFKEMDAISQVSQFPNYSWAIYFIYIYIYIFYIVCILTLEFNLVFVFFGVRLWGATKDVLLQMQFDLCLNIVNYLFIMQQKL